MKENLEDLGFSIVVVGGRKVGFVLGEITRSLPCFASREYGSIDDPGVAAEWRERGIGQQLVEKLMTWFVEKGIRRIETRVLLSNKLARKFWEKEGFAAYMSCVYKDV